MPGFSNHGSHRKYVSVLRFFNQYRTPEKQFFSSSLAELRHLVWALVQLADAQFSTERNTHRKLQAQLGKLKDTIQ